MPRPEKTPLMDVVEPPRDGEFFFDEAEPWWEQRRKPRGGFVERHPIWSLGSAVVLGVLVASVLLRN